MLTPLTMRARASSPKRISLAAMFVYLEIIQLIERLGLKPGDRRRRRAKRGRRGRSTQDREDVVFLDHQDVGAVELHFGAGVLAEQHLVADLDLRGARRTVVERLALAHGDDFTLDGL